jgi:hypothetical protein
MQSAFAGRLVSYPYTDFEQGEILWVSARGAIDADAQSA